MNLVQYRMARGALDWTSRQVCEAARISAHVMQRYQGGKSIPETDVKRIHAAFEAAGVEFLAENGCGVGVRLRGAST